MCDATQCDSVDEQELTSDFAPSDLADGRGRGDWCSRYTDPRAQRGIRFEATYLVVLLIGIPICMVVLWFDYPKYWVGLSDDKYDPVLRYGIAWLGGILGGTLFAAKWLYHSVAKQGWHMDRRLWRIFTPHISGGLAFVVVALVSSGLFTIFDRQAFDSLSSVAGAAFLVGYFSDSAIAKLTEIAQILFGATQERDS